MEEYELKKRLADLSGRAEKYGSATASSFLTPAEQYSNADCGAYFTGGYAGAERKIAVFIPDWMDNTETDDSEFISCIKAHSYFGQPGHRDYLGAVLGLGISRDRIGDIIIDGETAYIICTVSVKQSIVSGLDKVGRISVKTEEIPLNELPLQEKKTKTVAFTLKSLRLDACVADMFKISRTDSAQAIRQGMVSLNYSVSLKPDAQVKLNDVISFRGKGKGFISEIGGKSRRDRIFVTAEIFI